jgi:glycosyltransferase involved in cell wall biosynthesis
MNFRFARITAYYPQVIKWFYNANPASVTEPYSRQYELLTAQVLDHVTSYIRVLNQTGNYALEIISNAFPLIHAWKRENNLPEYFSIKETILHQLKKFKPQAIWLDDLSLVDEAFIAEIKSSIPELKLLITHLCAPFNKSIANKLKLFDLTITCTPSFLQELHSLGLNAALIYHGFDKEILKIMVSAGNRNHDLVFSGSLYTGSAFHQGRIQFLERLIEAGLNVELFANTESHLKFSARKIYEFLKHGPATAHAMRYYSKRLIKHLNPPVFGKEMYSLLGKSKICFNMHGEVAGNSAGNIRMFEATGMGACLVTDDKENISELFEPEKEIVTYRSAEECIDKIKWLLAHPAALEKIAQAGRQRTLTDHTIDKRAKQFVEIINRHLK